MDSQSNQSWEINPHTGVGVLHFGRPRSEIRSLLGPPLRSFKKGPFAENETDAYDHLGFHLYYDHNDMLESVDAWGPSRVHFQGVALLGVPVETLARELAAIGLTHRSYLFLEAGFSLYVVDGIVTSVSIFVSGYHNITDPNSAASRVNRAVEAWKQRQREKRTL